MHDTRRAANIKRLQEIAALVEAIRRDLEISEPGEVLYKRTLDVDRKLLVIADGLGALPCLLLTAITQTTAIVIRRRIIRPRPRRSPPPRTGTTRTSAAQVRRRWSLVP
jgi:hypothetical protein